MRDRRLHCRLRKTLCYAYNQKLNTMSSPMIDFTVDYFDKACPYDRLDEDFVCRLSVEGAVSPYVFIVALLYLERMRVGNRRYFELQSASDLLAVALLCAHKFLFDDDDDDSVYNKIWAASCSKRLDDLNALELEFLHELDWKLFVRPEQFSDVMQLLEYRLAKRQSSQRQFCTYTELEVLSRQISLKVFGELILKPVILVVSVVSLSYLLAISGLHNYGALLKHRTSGHGLLELTREKSWRNDSDLVNRGHWTADRDVLIRLADRVIFLRSRSYLKTAKSNDTTAGYYFSPVVA